MMSRVVVALTLLSPSEHELRVADTASVQGWTRMLLRVCSCRIPPEAPGVEESRVTEEVCRITLVRSSLAYLRRQVYTYYVLR